MTTTQPTHREVFEALYALALSAQHGEVEGMLNCLKRNDDDLGAFDNALDVVNRAVESGYADEVRGEKGD